MHETYYMRTCSVSGTMLTYMHVYSLCERSMRIYIYTNISEYRWIRYSQKTDTRMRSTGLAQRNCCEQRGGGRFPSLNDTRNIIYEPPLIVYLVTRIQKLLQAIPTCLRIDAPYVRWVSNYIHQFDWMLWVDLSADTRHCRWKHA